MSKADECKAKKRIKMKLICLLIIIALLTLSGASRCPYNDISATTNGILIRGNATHEAVNGKLIPKEEVILEDNLFWKCEYITRDNTKVKDCKLYERIYLTWDNSTNCSIWDKENETVETQTNETQQIDVTMLMMRLILNLFGK